VDIVSKGGNFQVGTGPDSKGKFHPKAIEALEYVGDWLKVNGEAIYATRPYQQCREGDSIRYTRSKDNQAVYAICLKWPGKQLVLKSVWAAEGSEIRLLGFEKPMPWRQDANGLAIEIPESLQSEAARPCQQAYSFKITAGK
jgi:alpha-L-fucosidase